MKPTAVVTSVIGLALAVWTVAGVAAPGVKSIAWTPGQVIEVTAKRGYVSQIVLGEDEVVVKQAGGDTAGWEVVGAPGDHVVYLKPRQAAQNTNLIVTTSRRNYVVDLRVLPDAARQDADWQIQLTHPQAEAAAKREAQVREALAQAEAARVVAVAREEADLKRGLAERPLVNNRHYSMQAVSGSEDITPSETYDDGRYTYIRIANNREMPAVYRIGADGAEALVDSHIERQDWIVVHEVARRFVLRLGRQVVGLWNDAFDVEGVPARAGVAGEGVERYVKEGL